MKRLLFLAALGVALAACSSGGAPRVRDGTIQGRFVIIGGPAPGTPRAISGPVEIVDRTGTTRTVEAGSDGRFSVSVPAGRYTLTGRSCATPSDVEVRAGATASVQVACHVP